ncbi:hydrogenase maturation nickel metallochaperone HypA/HybF [Desulfogranum japonicum]|uniref:hydrogenase maturation nickel metallochaperone HypA/HybF n=1 Tax=Desulfogranum japonicum TaxID=231447 RepID=UPI0003F5B67E|nr:hydrogenase maturation nickel metallochaperone HypA [Desulfogranum japonicum]
MHELSLAQSLLEQLLGLARQHNADTISKVTVILGPFSGIVADSFDFGFNILKKEYQETKEAELILEKPTPEYLCLECQHISAMEPAESQIPGVAGIITGKHSCPKCNSDRLSPQGGTDLILKQIEME